MVDLDVIVCPYCGADIAKTDSRPDPEMKAPSLEETVSSLYPPPYKPKSPFAAKEEIPEQAAAINPNNPLNSMESLSEAEPLKTAGGSKKNILTTLLFSLGVNLFIFSLFLLFFSTNGELFLKWDTSLWYLYTLVGLSLAFGGWRLLNKSETEPKSQI
jgi:hypothetical protein